MFAEELAQRAAASRPVQELVKQLHSKHFAAQQNGHSWFSMNLEKDCGLHVAEANKMKECFEEVARHDGFVFDVPSGESPFLYTFRLEPTKGPTWPGSVKALLITMKAKCKQAASNGHASCSFDLVEDGLLHEVEASKIKDSFTRAARAEGLNVKSWSGLVAEKPCFEIRWGAKVKRNAEDGSLDRPRKAFRAGA
eukprot:gb/GFBE01069361.1/.p1 GENE.gb/GFBE01069361.1/~~gb/GFBE01069361.1/.p1  ORF type:complete len:195 (+),score=49.30 gb/GFBE01069361.1/:1-585(+)